MIETGGHLRKFFSEDVSYIPPEAEFVGNSKGAVAIFNYDGDNCELAMAGSDGWLSKTLIRCVFTYVFCVLNCARATARVTAKNTRALQIDLRLGFYAEGVMRKAVDGNDIVVLGMLKEECRWINEQSKSAKTDKAG